MALLRSRDCSCLSSLLDLDLSHQLYSKHPQDLEPLTALVNLQSLNLFWNGVTFAEWSRAASLLMLREAATRALCAS